MASRIATILLICCGIYCVTAQYNDEPTAPKKPLQIPGARRVKNPKLSTHAAQTSINVTPRFRRPVSVNKPRPSTEPIPELPVFTSGIRGSKPSSILNYEQNDEAPLALPIQTIHQQPHIVHAQSIPQSHLQQGITEVKPVSEVNEKDEDVVQVIANLGAVSNYGAQGNLLIPTTASPIPILPTAKAYLHPQQLLQQQQQQQQQAIKYRTTQQHQISRTSVPSILPEQAILQAITPVQYRPQKPVRLDKPQQRQQQQQQNFVERNEYDLNEAVRPVVKQKAHLTPKKSKPQSADYYEGRTKKPVAQVIRRYREEMSDGSILWGFENDDGSFKEELIGIDCITRGKYGYVDPDGVKREYTYETGIKCDEESQQQQDQDILNTFVDYQENKLVLPNGKTIDLSNMGKKQSRRPQPLYRN